MSTPLALPSVHGWPVARGLAAGAALVLPAAILVAPHLGEAAFATLAILGLYAGLRHGAAHLANPRLRLAVLLMPGFYLVALLTGLASGDHAYNWWNPAGLREFLAAPLIGILSLETRPAPRMLMLTVKLAAITVCLVALQQLLSGEPRPGGAVNPLVFALVALLLGFFSMVRLPLETRSEKLFSLAAFFAGGMACVMSQSRTAWLVSVFLFAGLLLVWRRNGLLTKRLASGFIALMLVLMLAASQTPLVAQRVDSALAQYHALRADGEWRSSLGKRVIMWEGGLSAAREKPLFGWGADNSQAAAAAQLSSPAMQRAVLGYNHLHNEYINTLVARGLPGLLSLAALLFVPLYLFTRRTNDPERQLVVNGIGSLLCLGYALSGLSNLAFGDDTLNIFFVYFLAVTLPWAET